MSFQYYFPLDAEYVIRAKLGGANPRPVEMKLAVKAGLRTVGVTFLRESTKAEAGAPGGRRGGGGLAGGAPAATKEIMGGMDLRLDGVKLQRFPVPENGPLP